MPGHFLRKTPLSCFARRSSCAVTGLELLQFLYTLLERRLKLHRSKTFGAQAAIERRSHEIGMAMRGVSRAAGQAALYRIKPPENITKSSGG
jgi:hypothetical protein